MARRALRSTVQAAVGGGTAAIAPDPDRDSGWILSVDGTAQSYIDLADPTNLAFEYMVRIAHVIDSEGPARLRVLHLGGGAMSLARYVSATRPGSRNLVIEPDAALVELVREHLPWPRAWQIRIRSMDAQTALANLPTASADVVILDAFRNASTPGDLTTAAAFEQADRLLRPGGMLVVNVADGGALVHARRVAASAGAVLRLDHVISDPPVLRGRRFGNLVIVARRHDAAPAETSTLSRACASDPWPARVVSGSDLDAFVGTHRPFRLGDAPSSPPPPTGLLRGR